MGRKRTKSGKIRLAEVAELAGVSPITASRFFRNPEALSVAKRTRVESAARELGYVPNLAARALASQRTEVIGVLIPSLTNNVFSDVLRGSCAPVRARPPQGWIPRRADGSAGAAAAGRICLGHEGSLPVRAAPRRHDGDTDLGDAWRCPVHGFAGTGARDRFRILRQ